MKLHAAIDAYLTAKRASGRLYETTEALLRSFARGAGDIPLKRITPGTVVESQIYPWDRHDFWLDYLVTDSLGKRISPGEASVLAFERTYWKP